MFVLWKKRNITSCFSAPFADFEKLHQQFQQQRKNYTNKVKKFTNIKNCTKNQASCSFIK